MGTEDYEMIKIIIKSKERVCDFKVEIRVTK